MPWWYAARVVVRIRLTVPLGATRPPQARAPTAGTTTKIDVRAGTIKSRTGRRGCAMVPPSAIVLRRHGVPRWFPTRSSGHDGRARSSIGWEARVEDEELRDES